MLSLDDYQKPYGSIEEATKESDRDFAYIAGSDGLFKLLKIGGPEKPLDYTVVTSIREAPSLRQIQTGFFIKRVKKIPGILLARCAAIFRKVYERHNSEMIMILRWNKEQQEYYLDRAKFGAIGPGYLRYCFSGERCGTIHSHGAICACFSSTDDKDDLQKSGIHIVMGGFGSTRQSIVSSITGSGERFSDWRTDLDDWVWSHEIAEEEYDWFMGNILLIEDIQRKSDGYYIIEKGSKKVAYWTQTQEEAEALVDPSFEIEKVVKVDWSRFYRHEPITKEVKRKEKKKSKRRKKKKKTADPHIPVREKAITEFVTFILRNGLTEYLMDTFIEIAPLEKTEEMLDYLFSNIPSSDKPDEPEEIDEDWFGIIDRREEITDPDEIAFVDGTGVKKENNLCSRCSKPKECVKRRDNRTSCYEFTEYDEENKNKDNCYYCGEEDCNEDCIDEE